MAPAVVAIILISLFVEGFSAPSRCADCQTWESHSGSQTQRGLSRQTNRDDLSQRSGNLEDLTQQAGFELNRSPNQLTFDNTRPGNWTDVNHYGTSDGHGRVYEEQGQRVDGPTRIRYMRKNFTSSYTSGGLGTFGETNLGRIYPHVSQDASQLLNREALDQTQNSAYDQFAIRRNSHNTQNSLHSTERLNSRNDASRYYETHGSSGRLRETSSDQSTQQGLNTFDQTRPGNWSTVNTYRTDGGNGRVYEERRQLVTGPRQVLTYRRNYTSSYSSGGDIPTFGAESDETRNIDSNVQQQQRQFDSLGRELHETTGGYTRYYSGYHTRPSQTTGQTNYRYVSRPSSYEPSDSNSHQTYQHTTRSGNHHGSQSGSSSVSESGQVNERIPISGGSSSSYVRSSSYDIQGAPEISSVQQSGRLPGSESQTRQTAYGRYSDADYRRIFGSQDLGQRGISSSNLNNQQESYYTESHGTQIPVGQIRHYDQLQTTSTSGSSSAPSINHPDMDVTTIQSGGNRGTQHRFNTYNSRDRTVNDNYDRSYGVQSGHLVTQGLDLGQISQVPDCAEGTNGHSSYEQSYSHRVYRGTSEPQHFTQQVEDLTQQSEDLTQQTEDLTQQTEDLTQHTQDLTQQTEDLTQQSQDFGQRPSSRPGKLEVGGQQVEGLTQQTQDLTQQTEDFTQQSQDFSQRPSSRPGKLEVGSQQVEDLTQQTQDLTQQTEDLTQQTQDLTQQTEDFTQQSQDFSQRPFSRPGKLEVGSQQVEDLTQQTQDLTQQTEDLTQQTQDLTQQTEDFAQQSQDFSQRPSSRPGKLEVGSQQVEHLTQQTQDLTQQTEDLTQQTQDLNQQTEDLTQQTQDLTQQTEDFTQQSQDFSQRPSSRPGELEVGSQQVEDLTQQTQDLTQQTEDLTQQTQDLTQQTEDLTQQTQDFRQQTLSKPGELEVGSQQVQDLSQHTQDLTQQTEDFTQQNQDFNQRPSSRPGRLEVGSQRVEDLTQQTQDLTQQTEDLSQQTQDFGQQSSWKQGQLEVGSQQVEDLTQQTQDLSQQTVEGMQQDYSPLWNHERRQTNNPNYAPLPIEHQEIVRPQYSGIANQQPRDQTQQTDDFTQQTDDFGQQTEDLTQQTEDVGQQTEDLTQQTEDLGQETEDLTQQTEDLGQQTEDLTQQTEEFGQQTEDLTQQTEGLLQQGSVPADPPLWHHETSSNDRPDYEPPSLSSSSVHQEAEPPKTSDITSQQTEDLAQQTVDLGQQAEDLSQQTVDLGQENEDLTQQTVDLGQENEDLTQQTVDLGQENEDLTQQTVDLGQENEDLTQQTVDLGQENEDLTQQTVDLGQQTQGTDDYLQIPESSWRPGQVEVGSQQTENLNQQTQGFGQEANGQIQQTESIDWDRGQITSDSGFGQQTSWNSQNLENSGQQTEGFNQQTQGFGQEANGQIQQTEGIDWDGGQITSDSGFGQQTSWNSQNLENSGQQTESLNQQTQNFGQEANGQIQQTENIDWNGGQITSDSGFGQQNSWNYQNLDNSGQQTETFNQENQFDGQQPNIPPQQVTGRAPKPAPKPRRPRPTNSHHTQQINIEMEEPTVSNAESHTSQHNDQENNEKWVSTNVPSASQRGDQGINVNSNESGETDIQIESEIPKVPEHQVEYVSTYPDSSGQETTGQNQFRETQFTKTKTSRRGGHPGAQYQGPQGWHSPRDSQVSQEPTIFIDRHQLGHGNSGDSSFQQSTSTGQVTEDLQQHLTSIKEGDALESAQTVQIIQPVGAGIESRQRQSGQSDRIIFPDSPELSFEPRILEAFGAKGPYGDHDLDIFDSAKPNTDPVVLTPPEEGSDWDIREVDRRVTTTTEIPTTPLLTTTSATTTITTPLPPSPPPPPPTPAPGFWKKFGNTLASTVDKAKDKARDWFG